jgi:glutathione S-transferase
MKLFYGAGSCSIGIHVLLEELGHPYDAEAINLREGDQRKPEYAARNAKMKVPLLEREDGSTLTEYGAISHYLAAGTALAPQGREAEARAIEALDFIVGTIHMQGFARIFRAANFTPNAADEDWVKGRGRDLVAKGFEVIAGTLGEQAYLFGDFSYVDCALFYVEFWAGRAGLALPAPLAAHLARMLARPAVAKVLAAEKLG